jgi:hypothetical protein
MAAEFEPFDLSDQPENPKGFEQKFFAEVLPKYNKLVELRKQYVAIAGGVESAIESVIDSVTEESNAEVFEMLNSIAEAEELITELNAKVRTWAESQVAETSESPEKIREEFESVKATVSKKIEGSSEYFETNDDIEEAFDEEGNSLGMVGSTTAGKLYIHLQNLPSIRKGSKGGKSAGTGFGKRVREWINANGIKSPEGEELGKVGVLPQWAKDAYVKANPTESAAKAEVESAEAEKANA